MANALSGALCWRWAVCVAWCLAGGAWCLDYMDDMVAQLGAQQGMRVRAEAIVAARNTRLVSVKEVLGITLSIMVSIGLLVVATRLNHPVIAKGLMMLSGMAVGAACRATHQNVAQRLLDFAPAHSLLACFEPVLLFNSTFNLDPHLLKRCYPAGLLMGVLGLLLNALLVGFVMNRIFHSSWSWDKVMLFGVVCACTMNEEVLNLLNDSGQVKQLGMVLATEGVCAAVVLVYTRFLEMGISSGHIGLFYQPMLSIPASICLDIAVGYVAGRITKPLLDAASNSAATVLCVLFNVTYLVFFVSKFFLHSCGSLSVVVLGLACIPEKDVFSNDVRCLVKNFTDSGIFIIEALIFCVCGCVLTEELSDYIETNDYYYVIVTYMLYNMTRFVIIYSLSPILVRLPSGFNRRMALVASWAGIKGPFTLMYSYSIVSQRRTVLFGMCVFVHCFFVTLLSNLINGWTFRLLMRNLGMCDISLSRVVNMNICMRNILQKRAECMAALQTERMLSDANWRDVENNTVIRHPYRIQLSEEDEDDNLLLGYRVTSCPECKREVVSEPTEKELEDMAREARIRVLKAKKVSYGRQYDLGMISKEANRVLSQAIDAVLDLRTSSHVDVEGLSVLYKENICIKAIQRLLRLLIALTRPTKQRVPRNKCRAYVGHIVTSIPYEVMSYCATMGVFIFTILELTISYTNFIAMACISAFWLMVFSLNMTLRIISLAYLNLAQGFRTYFNFCCSWVTFMGILGLTGSMALHIIEARSSGPLNGDAVPRIVMGFKVVVVVRTMRLVLYLWKPATNVMRRMNRKLDSSYCHAYDVGRGFVYGEKEVMQLLPQMIDNQKVYEKVHKQLEEDCNRVARLLGEVQKERPWVPITVKTRQITKATLNNMRDATCDLRTAGWIDDNEFNRFIEVLDAKMRVVNKSIKFVEPSPPESLFREVTWMSSSAMADFLFASVQIRNFADGTVIMNMGQEADGIYIIISGLCKLQYSPRKEVLERLAETGTLPVIDYVNSLNFDTPIEEYLVSGNPFGELSVLTQRVYDCTITADADTQVYFLANDVVARALQVFDDKLHGLESHMWKAILIRLAIAVLLDTSMYETFTPEALSYELEHAFVPNLKHFKTFTVTDQIREVVLLEGCVKDQSTGEMYVGPCYIPKTVQKLELAVMTSDALLFNTHAKIMIIPLKNTNVIDLMDHDAVISAVFSSSAGSKCSEHSTQLDYSASKLV